MPHLKIRFKHDKYQSERLVSSINQMLEANTLLSMATTCNSKSHINTAYYCYNPKMDLYILTYPSSIHGKNLTKNTSVAITIFDSKQKWDSSKKGLQLFGTCRPARGHELIEALSLYGRRFKGIKKWVKSIFDIKKLDSRFYIIKIERVKLFDESNFGEENFITLHK